MRQTKYITQTTYRGKHVINVHTNDGTHSFYKHIILNPNKGISTVIVKKFNKSYNPN